VRAAVVLALVIATASCGGATSTVKPSSGATQQGKASWYGDRFHGRKTANGERFDMNGMTAAHRTLPFGSRVKVTNLRNGRVVEVRINDRGPFGGRGRIIDVSKGAARKLGMISDGVVPVRLDVVCVPARRGLKARC
jgi:rare lipoprotein A